MNVSVNQALGSWVVGRQAGQVCSAVPVQSASVIVTLQTLDFILPQHLLPLPARNKAYLSRTKADFDSHILTTPVF